MTGKIFRGVAALAVLAILCLVVWNWYGDFKRAPKNTAETTSTAEPSATPSPDKQGSGAGAAGGDAPASQAEQTQPTTIVTLIDGVNFRPKPDSTAKALRGLNKGETLTLIAKQGDWYHVTTSDGTDGYVTANPQYTTVQK
jgi:uncharacterized protein YgiM (DUF1202 family)